MSFGWNQISWVAVDKVAIIKLKSGIKKPYMQNPELEKTSLGTNTPSKDKAHLLCVPGFLS